MFDFANLGNLSGALKATGSNYQLPADAAAPAAPTASGAIPGNVNSALEAAGASYRVPTDPTSANAAPGWVDSAKKATDAVDSAPADQNPENEHPGLKNSPIAGLAKKVVGAVAAFYTGGASAAAMNVGGQMLSKNNPKLGTAASATGLL